MFHIRMFINEENEFLVMGKEKKKNENRVHEELLISLNIQLNQLK